MVGKKPEMYFELHVADILWHVPIKVPDLDCGWHFLVLYLGKIPITSMCNFSWQKFHVAN